MTDYLPDEQWKLELLERDMPYLTAFCRRYGAEYEGFEVTQENFPEIPWELLYIFTDGNQVQGYTIEGVINSLEPTDLERIEEQREKLRTRR